MTRTYGFSHIVAICSAVRPHLVGMVGLVLLFWPSQTAVASYVDVVLADNPLHYWRLNETTGTAVADIGSATIAGTYNGPTLGYDGPQPGLFVGFESDNNAPDFDGSNDRIELAGLATMTAWTLEVWAKLDVVADSQTILSNDRLGWNDDVLFGLCPEGNEFSLSRRWAVVHQDDDNTARTIVSDTSDVLTNQWYYLAVTSDGSYLRLYVDGQLVGSASKQGNDLDFAGAMTWLGGNPQLGSGYRCFNGLIDEVAIYNRMLDSAKIKEHYIAAIPEPCALILFALGSLTLVLTGRRRGHANRTGESPCEWSNA